MINVIRKKGANPITKKVLYFIQWTRITTTAETALAKRMARGGTYSVGEASGVMLDFPQYIIDELLNGNAVSVAGLGTFKLKVQGKADEDPEKVTTRGAKASVVFEPDAELASRIETEAEFKIVTTPTPEGQSDADNAEVPTDNEGGEGNNENENENQSQGGGDNTGSQGSDGTGDNTGVVPPPDNGGGNSGGGNGGVSND